MTTKAKSPKAPKAPKAPKVSAPAATPATVDLAAERAASAKRTGRKVATPATPEAPAARVASPIRTDRKVGASKFSGTVLVRNVAGNPRRPGSFGALAFAYLAPNVGEAVPYEAFRAAVEADPKIRGGLNHISYDLAKGFVTAAPAATFAGKVRKVGA